MSEKKYEKLVRLSKDIITEYNVRLTIRQVYYQLVVKQYIQNNRSEYVYFDKCLTEARQKDLTLASYFDDRTRKIVNKSDEAYDRDTFSEIINYKLNWVKTSRPFVLFDKNNMQPKICVILLEKDALASVFEQAMQSFGGILVICRGFNSFTQLYELSKIVKNNKKEINVYCFTDFDDSGLLIQNNFLNQMRKYLKVKFDNVLRIALTKEQIESYELPQNPTKKTTHKNMNLPYFVELDALNPNVLTTMIQDCCRANFDDNLYNSMYKYVKRRNHRLVKKYEKELNKIEF